MESTFNPILHIEEDENDIVLLQRALAMAGISHPLQIVRNGALAIDYLLGRNPFARRELYPLPSLILLELDVPLVNGFEFLRWRQTRPIIKRIPVIVLTSSQEPTDVAAAYEAGANSYLANPVTFDGLVQMTRAIRTYWLMHNHYASPPDEANSASCQPQNRLTPDRVAPPPPGDGSMSPQFAG